MLIFSQTQRILPSLWNLFWNGNDVDRQTPFIPGLFLLNSGSLLTALIQSGGAIPLVAAALASGPLNEQFQQLVDSITGIYY